MLPDHFTGVVETGRGLDISALVVSSKTVEREKLASPPPPLEYICGETDSELYDLRGGESACLSDDELETVCRALADATVETESEHGRLRRAAGEVLNEAKRTPGDGR